MWRGDIRVHERGSAAGFRSLSLTSHRTYYDLRAGEYEAIYRRDDPVRKAELAGIAADLCEALAQRRVLEVACGTGYWTRVAGSVARSVVAIDSSEEMLAVAREKALPSDRVELRIGDAWALESVAGEFDAGLANFWFSHVPAARLAEFLDGFHRRLGPGAVVFMADNMYVPGIGGELVRREGVKDTYKIRELSDGTRHEVLKNYYEPDELRALLAPLGRDLRLDTGTCYWWARYSVLSVTSAV